MRQVRSLQVVYNIVRHQKHLNFKIVGLYVHVVFYVVLVCVCIDASDLAQMTNGADGRCGREVRRGRASAYGHECALGPAGCARGRLGERAPVTGWRVVWHGPVTAAGRWKRCRRDGRRRGHAGGWRRRVPLRGGRR
jgi:hypothetical protein